MLQNAYFLAKIGADTAENDEHFAEFLPKTGNSPTDPSRESAAAAAQATADEAVKAATANAEVPPLRSGI